MAQELDDKDSYDSGSIVSVQEFYPALMDLKIVIVVAENDDPKCFISS